MQQTDEEVDKERAKATFFSSSSATTYLELGPVVSFLSRYVPWAYSPPPPCLVGPQRVPSPAGRHSLANVSWVFPRDLSGQITAEWGGCQTKSHSLPRPQKFLSQFLLEDLSIYLSSPVSSCQWPLHFNWHRKLALSLILNDLKSHFPTAVRQPVKQSTNTEARTLK